MSLICCVNCGHRHEALRTVCPQCGLRESRAASGRSQAMATSGPRSDASAAPHGNHHHYHDQALG